MPFRFPENLPRFSPGVTKGFKGCSELQQGIKYALLSLANEQIENGSNMQCYWSPSGPYFPEVEPLFAGDAAFAPMVMDAPMASARTSGEAATTTSTEDSYGTNNQVEGADEADMIKSNGEIMCIAYGEEIIITDLNRNVVSRVTVPPRPASSDTAVSKVEFSIGGMSTPRMSLFPSPYPHQPSRKV